MNRFELISYAMEFCSFLIKRGAGEGIDNIILFGSVARGDFDEESDIDIFLDTRKDIEAEAKKALKAFELSEASERWRLRGLKNALSVKSGRLEDWRLRRAVISNGITLYGKYRERPDGMRYYLMMRLDFRGMERKEKIGVWRILYGYRQKIGSKTYISEGLLSKAGGKRMDRGAVIVPAENRDEIVNFLKTHRIKHNIDEIWSDTI
jgi:predicted nucleotidyltransferase